MVVYSQYSKTTGTVTVSSRNLGEDCCVTCQKFQRIRKGVTLILVLRAREQRARQPRKLKILKLFCAYNLRYFSLKFIEACFVPGHSIQEQLLERCIMGNVCHRWGTGGRSGGWSDLDNQEHHRLRHKMTYVSFRSISLSRKLPTYPSPKPTFCPK